MSKEKEARDLALREYDKFMDKYKANIEAGHPKLMQHMLKLEADKVRTQGILDSIENSSAGIDGNVYGDTKMKIQMTQEEYQIGQEAKYFNKTPKKLDEKEQAFVEMATRPISIGDPDKMDPYRIDPTNFGQIDPPVKEVKKEPIKQESSAVEIDKETGKKVYKGPKLKSRRVVGGKEWNEQHPDFR